MSVVSRVSGIKTNVCFYFLLSPGDGKNVCVYVLSGNGEVDQARTGGYDTHISSWIPRPVLTTQGFSAVCLWVTEVGQKMLICPSPRWGFTLLSLRYSLNLPVLQREEGWGLGDTVRLQAVCFVSYSFGEGALSSERLRYRTSERVDDLHCVQSLRTRLHVASEGGPSCRP